MPGARTIDLLPCPFCGQYPTAEPWHGGAPTKVMITCVGRSGSLFFSGLPDGIVECAVAPVVTGETHLTAESAWNHRATTSGTKRTVTVSVS